MIMTDNGLSNTKSNTSFNFIYSKLVDPQNPIPGIIAYSVYKQQKIEFIQKHKKNSNTDVSEEDLASFVSLSNSDKQLNFYRVEAENLVRNFLEDVLAADLKEREELFHLKLENKLKQIKPNHYLDIVKGALGSLLFVLITGVLYIAVYSLTISPKQIIEQVFKVNITDTKSSQ